MNFYIVFGWLIRSWFVYFWIFWSNRISQNLYKSGKCHRLSIGEQKSQNLNHSNVYGRAEIRNDAARRNFCRNFRSSSNHLLYCLNPTCFVNHWNRSSEWQTMFCDFLTSYLCGALLLSNFRSESCRSHCVQSHSSKASFTGGSMFRWWSGRSCGPDGFRSFSFQHKENSGWVKTNWCPGSIQRHFR